MQELTQQFANWSIGFACVSVCYFVIASSIWRRVRQRRQDNETAQTAETPGGEARQGQLVTTK